MSPVVVRKKDDGSTRSDLHIELEFAKQLARVAGEILRRHYRGKSYVRWKAEFAPVTTADREANELIVRKLRSKFPADGILSEESANESSRIEKSRVWVIDPMDGTREFIEMRDEFSVMIGLAIEGESVVGVVYQPTTDKMYFATSGDGCHLEEKEQMRTLVVSPEKDPRKMTIAISRSHHTDEVESISASLGIANKIACGSIGLKVGLICEGLAHLYLHPGGWTSQWDTCAADVILREAGGTLTDVFGNPIRYNDIERRNVNGVVASNGTIHHRLVELAKNLKSKTGMKK